LDTLIIHVTYQGHSDHRQTIMEASEAAASGPAAPRSPWGGKQGVDFNDIIDIFAKFKAHTQAVF